MITETPTTTITQRNYRKCPDPLCTRGAIVMLEPPVIGRASNGTPVYGGHLVPRAIKCGTCHGAGRVRIDRRVA